MGEYKVLSNDYFENSLLRQKYCDKTFACASNVNGVKNIKLDVGQMSC